MSLQKGLCQGTKHTTLQWTSHTVECICSNGVVLDVAQAVVEKAKNIPGCLSPSGGTARYEPEFSRQVVFRVLRQQLTLKHRDRLTQQVGTLTFQPHAHFAAARRNLTGIQPGFAQFLRPVRP